MYKVVIPSAGKGARLKDLSKHINKALVSVNQKPSISYVIEKFPEEIGVIHSNKSQNHRIQTVKRFERSTYRILGPAYMKAGMGDGGGCHPRDNIALRYMAENLGLGYDLFDAIM